MSHISRAPEKLTVPSDSLPVWNIWAKNMNNNEREILEMGRPVAMTTAPAHVTTKTKRRMKFAIRAFRIKTDLS